MKSWHNTPGMVYFQFSPTGAAVSIMTQQWHHLYCKYRVWAVWCQNVVKIWALVQKLLWSLLLGVMPRIRTYRDKQHSTVSQTCPFLCLDEDPVSFPVSHQTKKSVQNPGFSTKSHWWMGSLTSFVASHHEILFVCKHLKYLIFIYWHPMRWHVHKLFTRISCCARWHNCVLWALTLDVIL